MKKQTGWLISLLVIIGLVIVGWLNRYNIWDEWRLYDYTPPPAIAQLADQTTMTPYAKTLFYAYHPTIENATAFNQNCQVTQQAIVLGCTVINKGIWLYNVTDPQLNGVEQVTAAHEMLHVGYSRLSRNQLSYINGLVMATYNKLAPTDSLLQSEYQSYLTTEGQGAVLNELHSVLGTEISINELPQALNNYYDKYFTNRQVIVNYANQYENVFIQRQQIVQQDDKQLSAWQSQISTDEASLQSQNQQLQATLQQMDQLRASGQISAYNSLVDSYNSNVDSYNDLVTQTRNLISSYNQLVQTRNSVAVSEDNLIKSISSLPSTIPAQ